MSNSSLRGIPARRAAPLKPVKTHVRSMQGWSARSPFYRWYLLREATCVAVGYFALLGLCALERLGAGPAAWSHFLQRLAQPGWIVWHAALFALMLYHAWTWFAVLPKTIPFVFIGNTRVPDAWLVRAGWLASLATALALIAFYARG